MASNEDLLSYLKQMEEKRAKERLEDKAEYKIMREKERKEDREETKKVIQSCVEEKLSEAVKPLEEKNESVMKVQEQLKEQVDILSEQFKVLQEKVDTTSAHSDKAVQEQARLQQQDLQVECQLAGVQGQAVAGEQEGSLTEIISLARRTVGLFRIDQADLNRMRQPQFGGAKSAEEEKLLAVREYLRLELKLDPIFVEKMELENMFYTTKDKQECLFVRERSNIMRSFFGPS